MTARIDEMARSAATIIQELSVIFSRDSNLATRYCFTAPRTSVSD
jgi:hypothetical protein